jgi:hypothetical protein
MEVPIGSVLTSLPLTMPQPAHDKQTESLQLAWPRHVDVRGLPPMTQLDHHVQHTPMHDAVPYRPKPDRLALTTPDFPTPLIGPHLLLSSVAAAP